MRKLIAWLGEPNTIIVPRWQRYVLGFVMVSINLYALLYTLMALTWLVMP